MDSSTINSDRTVINLSAHLGHGFVFDMSLFVTRHPFESTNLWTTSSVRTCLLDESLLDNNPDS